MYRQEYDNGFEPSGLSYNATEFRGKQKQQQIWD
jgi:hypothetical protein